MLEIQKYLKTNSLYTLQVEHGVYAKIVGHKFTLNYDQIESAESDKIAQECRGLVLKHNHKTLNVIDIVGDTEVLAYPFKRFFNYGQGSADKINFNDKSLKIYEKFDGTCIIFYFDFVLNKWTVATRSLPEANVKLDSVTEHTFTSLFELTVEKVTGYSYQEWLSNASLDKDYTYIFELMTPINRIVVDYKEYDLRLLGLRNIKTLQEKEIESVDGLYIKPCESYKFNSLKDILKFVSGRNPLEFEGVVACDSKFRRNKMKNAEYMAYTRMKDRICSNRAIMQIVLSGKLDDFYPVLPEHIKINADIYSKHVRELYRQIQVDFDFCKSKLDELGVMSEQVSRKQFCLFAEKHATWFAPVMYLYNKKGTSVSSFFESQKDEAGNYKKAVLDHLLSRVEKEKIR